MSPGQHQFISVVFTVMAFGACYVSWISTRRPRP